MLPRSCHEAQMQDSWFLATFFNLNCISPGLFGYRTHSGVTSSILFYQFVLF